MPERIYEQKKIWWTLSGGVCVRVAGGGGGGRHVFWHFLCRARCQIYSKQTIKTPEYLKLTVKLKLKTPLASFWRLFVNFEHISLHVTAFRLSTLIFDQLTAGWGCCLYFWRFVPSGLNLGKVSTYGETR